MRSDRKQRVFRKGKCRICKKRFAPTSGRALTCQKCLTTRPLCICGCGQLAASIKTSGHPVMKLFVHGHNRRGTETKVASANAKIGWAGMSDETKKARSRKISATMKKKWDSMPEDKKAERVLRGLVIPRFKPNKAELGLKKILDKAFPKEFRLNVCGGFVLGGKVPDFVNVNGKKVVVEMAGRYWHKPSYEKERKATFARYGFRTAVIWEKELKDAQMVADKVHGVMHDQGYTPHAGKEK